MKKISYFITVTIFTGVLCRVERPRGVALSKASLYMPGKPFTCFDGSKTVPFSQINDDYCDCSDGSDEPGTSACPNGNFHCTNAGHKPMYIPSSRVNDGICDCCDGTDEFEHEGLCQNTCKELGRAAREEAEKQRELMKQGFEIYQKYAKDGFEAKQERQRSLEELQKQKDELEAKRKELEDLKNAAEAPERLAKDAHKKAWEEEKEKRDLEKDQEAASEAFAELDTNQDTYVTVEEMKTHPEFDIDSNSEVAEEEAKEFLEDHEQVDFETFQTEIWPNIKAIYKPPSTNHVPREAEPEEDKKEEENQAEEKEPEPYDDLDNEPDYYEDGYDDEDEYYDEDDEDDDDDYDERDEDHVARYDSADEDSDGMPEYDEHTKQLIAEADKAREAYEEADDKYRDVEKQLNDINKFLSLDLGDENEFFPLKDNCYEYTDREYTYKLCPFEKATQRSKSGGGDTSLGKWGRWDGPEGNKYSVMLFENGQGCWNGPNRSVKVHIKCGITNELVGASEPNRCEYEFQFRSPAACSNVEPYPKPDPEHDEL